MSFDCHEMMKPLLYADLFKPDRKVSAGKEETATVSEPEVLSLSSSSSSSSNQFSRCDSSSSGFSTPLYSDLSDDGDFIAELSRQMAECMLQEDEEVVVVKENTLKNNPYSTPVCVEDGDRMARIPPIHRVYQMKNQQPISKGTESGQQKQVKRTEQHFRGKGWGIGHGRNGQFGSGMQAVFLGGSGSGSISGSSGTGVFLPRDSSELKKKSGCSMVLMPTRVLHALELHYNRYKDSTNPPPPLTGGPLNYSYPRGESTVSNGPRNGHSQTANSEDMQLPQEWTY